MRNSLSLAPAHPRKAEGLKVLGDQKAARLWRKLVGQPLARAPWDCTLQMHTRSSACAQVFRPTLVFRA